MDDFARGGVETEREMGNVPASRDRGHVPATRDAVARRTQVQKTRSRMPTRGIAANSQTTPNRTGTSHTANR